MRMTETLAATVAAVAPVIWLVGAVELHQISRQWAVEAAEFEALYARGSASLAAKSGDEAWRELAAFNAQVETALIPAERSSRAKVVAYGIWLAVSGALAVAAILSLVWLASDGGKSELVATYCVVSLSLGFACVTVAPVVLSLRQTHQAQERRRAHSETIQRRLADMRNE